MPNYQHAPAWYLVRSRGKLARWFNLLHWPYTLWHLSYVVIGATLAPAIDWALLGWSVLAFFLAVGIASHAADQLNGDPLRLSLKRSYLVAAMAISLVAAAAIGITQFAVQPLPAWTLLLIPAGVLMAIGYGLEWPGLHGDVQFALWWAVFPLAAGYIAQDQVWRWELVPVVLLAFLTGALQRWLSKRSKAIRRGEETGDVAVSGRASVIDEEGRLKRLDSALLAMSFAIPLAAGALLITKV